MGIRVVRFDKLTREDALALQKRIVEYYTNPPEFYYDVADQAAGQYTSTAYPFHCDLVGRIMSGASLLELGCGSAHLCPYVTSAGGSYTGIDHSQQLLRQNRARFPHARFFSVGTELRETFDVVASLYTIEHVVDPPLYLESMWRFCKPGGLIAVICPDFVDGDGFPPSFFYGVTARHAREKLLSLAIADVLGHLLDLLWFAPQWKREARSSLPGAFWINVKPRILHGAAYSIDADAIHLPRLKDLIWWLEARGASVIETSRSLSGVSETVLKHNCYVVARKPIV